jgi:hypothetical protein
MKLAGTSVGRELRVDLIRHTFRAPDINCTISADWKS